MNSTRIAALCLGLALCLAAPALANDFIKPSPVPSSRDNIKPTKAKKLPAGWQNLQGSQKIVKTTKPTGALPAQTTTGAGQAQ